MHSIGVSFIRYIFCPTHIDKTAFATPPQNIVPIEMSVFKNKNIKVRKAFLLKCIKSLPKNRIGKLLKDYFDLDGQRYYNVIYWLDLGVSLPSGVSRLAAQRAIVAGI